MDALVGTNWLVGPIRVRTEVSFQWKNLDFRFEECGFPFEECEFDNKTALSAG